MNFKLRDIATVSSGVTFRSRIEPSREGDVTVIQMKDLDDNNLVILDDCMQVNFSNLKPKQLVKAGDIIFRSRGKNNTAAQLKEEIPNVIVAAPLFCIKPNTDKVTSDYLLWWINQPSSQAYLSSRSKGTTVKMISKQAIEDLEIKLPTLEQQRTIGDYFNFSNKEQVILEKIKNQRALYAQALMMSLASNQGLNKINNKESRY